MPRTYDVVVVGGGIGGLALGCALTESQRSVLILEARTRILPSKRGLSLQANGLEVLQKMGLLERIRKVGVATRHVAWFDLSGELLADLDYSVLNHPNSYLLTVIPSELEEILREEFLRRGGELEESTNFKGLTRQRDDVTVTASRNETSLEFSTKILVGADGQESAVRQSLQFPTKVRENPDHFLFMLADSVDVIRQDARQYFGRGKMIGLFPIHGGTYIFHYIPRGAFNVLIEEGLDQFKAGILRIIPEMHDALGNLRSWNDILHVAPKRIEVRTWVRDRVALLGDAVHALDPSWAQGANMTLRDAEALAEIIEKCFQSGDFTVNKLIEYETMRRKQTTFIQQQSDRTARLTATENRVNLWAGKRIIRNIGANRDLMRISLRASAGLTDHFSMREQLRFLL